MKRMCWILIGTALMLSTSGCQHQMFRRGARCRPGLGMPSLGLPRLFNHNTTPPPAAAAPGCNSGCNSGGPMGPPNNAYMPGPYMGGEVSYPSGEVIVGESGPIETVGPMQVNQRPIITGSPASSSSGVLSDVPGPESAPLPN